MQVPVCDASEISLRLEKLRQSIEDTTTTLTEVQQKCENVSTGILGLNKEINVVETQIKGKNTDKTKVRALLEQLCPLSSQYNGNKKMHRAILKYFRNALKDPVFPSQRQAYAMLKTNEKLLSLEIEKVQKTLADIKVVKIHMNRVKYLVFIVAMLGIRDLMNHFKEKVPEKIINLTPEQKEYMSKILKVLLK
ncbi:MAG: hypothetical protein H0W88_00190 [Parachlamydiaceae bacterium]|nr:hypothetical protein [Parachlamydiaceae bacterium]